MLAAGKQPECFGNVNLLPSDLLCNILSLTDLRTRIRLPLVCKLWSRLACDKAKTFWAGTSVDIFAEDLAFHKVIQGLSRYGATITALDLTVEANSAWHEYHRGAVCLFNLMPCLQQLLLMCPGPFLDASRDLARLDVLPHLRNLTMRDLSCSTPWQEGSLSSLSMLKKLEHLSIEINLPDSGSDLGSKVLPPSLTSLTCLTHLDSDNSDLGCVVGQLMSLEEVWLGCMHACIPSGLSGLPCLKNAYLGDVDNRYPDGPTNTYFEEGALQACPSLTWLLLNSFDGVTENGARSLFQCVSALTSLQNLSFQSIDLNMWSALGNGLPSRILHLALVDCRLTTLPPCLVHHQYLISLDVRNNDITDLPPGPYLKHLRGVDVNGTTLLQVPAALLEAAKLLELVWSDPWHNDSTVTVKARIPASCSISKVKSFWCWPGDLGYPCGMDEWVQFF